MEGLDGRKMSSSWGNTINFNDEPSDMYGKIMSVRDELVEKYFILLTRVPMDEIVKIMQNHPKEAKMRLAREITAMYHGTDGAAKAEENFVATFQKGGIPEDLPEIAVARGEKISDALVSAGIVASKSELRRLQQAGAISDVEGGTISDLDSRTERPLTLRIGKHRFVTIV